PEARADLVRSINELVALSRARSWPVIWVRTEFDPDLGDALPEVRLKRIAVVIRGSAGASFAPGLDARPEEIVIVKKRYSAFYRTNLDEVLGAIAPRRLIVAGINTHACVRTTAIDAYQRDYDLIVARECVGSYDPEHHTITLRYFDGKIARVLSTAEIAG